MNLTETNKRIAIACGWTVIKESCSDRIGRFLAGYSPTDKENWVQIPNYHGDLNAMHEAEGTLKGESWCAYVRLLGEYTQEFKGLCYSTAAQRAEAFLRTIGQWEEGK